MEWIVIVTLCSIVLIVLYMVQMRRAECFRNDPQVLLVDRKTHVGLGDMGAGDCAHADQARLMELGGQYIQRTNNFRREHPDNCSAPLTEFVNSIYPPVDLGVPCAGLC